jgi:hypothetical protein
VGRGSFARLSFGRYILLRGRVLLSGVSIARLSTAGRRKEDIRSLKWEKHTSAIERPHSHHHLNIPSTCRRHLCVFLMPVAGSREQSYGPFAFFHLSGASLLSKYTLVDVAEGADSIPTIGSDSPIYSRPLLHHRGSCWVPRSVVWPCLINFVPDDVSRAGSRVVQEICAVVVSQKYIQQ